LYVQHKKQSKHHLVSFLITKSLQSTKHSHGGIYSKERERDNYNIGAAWLLYGTYCDQATVHIIFCINHLADADWLLLQLTCSQSPSQSAV
jgi:hypothetical protein